MNTPTISSPWFSLHHHALRAFGAPGRYQIAAWAESGVTDVVTLQYEHEMGSWIPKHCEASGLTWHHLPLSGRRLQGEADKVSLKKLISWSTSLADPTTPPARIIVHCAAGLHRTGVALYFMCRVAGLTPEDTLIRIAQTRQLTADELMRQTRRNGRLIDVAEDLFQALTCITPEMASLS